MKIQKSVLAFLLAALISVFAVISVSATTYYYSSGYELYKDSNSNGWIINSCSLEDNEISLPSYLIGDNVTTIGGMSFQNRSSLTYIYMPDSITAVGAYAFSGCTSLNNIVFGENMESIYVGAFRYCDSLNLLDLSDTKLSLISNTAFYNCKGLTQVILPDTLESIGANAFANCPLLSKVVIGRNVNSISNIAFKDSPNTVIYCYYNTYAHEYAVNNNIPYILLDGVKLGDIDKDGHVTINDVTAIQRHLANYEHLEGIYLYAADVNLNKAVEISDATEIQKYLAAYEVNYPIGEIITQ